MKILVTGANGYLGQGVVKKLLDDGNEVVATDIEDNNIDHRAIIKKADLFSIENPNEFFENPEVLLHMAWRNGFIHNDLSHVEDLPKHIVFVKKLIENGIKKISVMGTMHEIGFYEGSINEDTPTHPESLYGISKDALRNTVKLLCKNNNVIFQWLRGYYIVGNSKFGSSIFSKITLAENKGQELFPFTLGMNQWDFIDYNEFCNHVVATVEQNEINGIINICNGRPEKLADRVERFIKDNNYRIKLDYGKFMDRPYDSKAVWGDDKKIKEILKNRKYWYAKKMYLGFEMYLFKTIFE